MVMAVQAINKNVRMSPRKVSVVAGLVRGRTVADALVILEHAPRRASEPVKKTILSAKSNAEHNHSYKPDSLFITDISVTAGPRYRRYRPAAFGRARRFARKTSHVKVVVDGQKRQQKKTAAKAENKETK